MLLCICQVEFLTFLWFTIGWQGLAQKKDKDTLKKKLIHLGFKWIDRSIRKIEEIIELMNGNPPRANYDKETLQILIEKYYIKKSEAILSKIDN